MAASARSLHARSLSRRPPSARPHDQGVGTADWFPPLVHQASSATTWTDPSADGHPDRRPWTEEELGILERLLGKVWAATFAKRLKRTETSVVMKIKALGHSRRVTEGYTIRDLELSLGEDHHKIQMWMAHGWVRDGLQGTNRHDGNGHDIHRFREKDLLNFIKAHPQEINLGKVDQVWFLDLVLLRGFVPHTSANSRPTDDEDECP